MTGWLLQEIEVEGFRGINNENAPLVLKFKTDKVNSISAPNGVGKSSIFDALTYALTGRVPKLEDLPAAEAGGSYYLNKFHSGGIGTIKLTLVPDLGGNVRTITVTRAADGSRTSSCSDGTDAEMALAELNREFVLLDAETFQNFISRAPLDRGRSFAGLLGLASYSALRQGLQSISNTRAFNNQFGDAGHKTARSAAERRVTQHRQAVTADYLALVKEPITDVASTKAAHDKAHHSLAQIALLADHCKGRSFKEIDVDVCATAIKDAEAGPDRQKLAQIIQQEGAWNSLVSDQPDSGAVDRLKQLARKRDLALAGTKGDLLRQLYELGERITGDDAWDNKNLCPACDNHGDTSILVALREKLDHYTAVEAAAQELSVAWAGDGWPALTNLEQKVLADGETSRFKAVDATISERSLTETEVGALAERLSIIRLRAKKAQDALANEREALSASLPPSLVAVTETVEAARRLQRSWGQLEEAEAELKLETTWAERTVRLKGFLDKACSLFSTAESDAGVRRLAAVEPLCQTLFAAIMHEPVVPALKKRVGTEELSISLSKFFSLDGGSAQALLSESFRNAFAASVYLAAAKLYGGAPRFLVLDDITSSFDAGHQYHLVEVIRTQFARPVVPSGPQVILLSHDTLLEKLFNKNVSTGGWWHQRLQGTARTAVLPQNNAVDKVGDRTRDFLNAGRVDDAAPYIRQYLEFRLEEVAQRCRIPVPLDLAFNENKQLAQGYLDAIDAAVDLNKKAGTLVLDAAQQASLSTHVATITGNYLAHWGTGSAHSFSAGALLGVMSAIDAYADCFRFSDPPGSPSRYYKSLGQRA